MKPTKNLVWGTLLFENFMIVYFKDILGFFRWSVIAKQCIYFNQNSLFIMKNIIIIITIKTE